MGRTAISKRARFEVFKRDGFVCQYCGAHPPAVLLEVDHIHPVSAGGGNEIENLVTACEACNRGKGARPLTVAPESLGATAKRVAEAEEQLRAYRSVIDAARQRKENDCWAIAAVIDGIEADEIQRFNRRDLVTIGRFLDRLDFHSVRDAAEIAYLKLPTRYSARFSYFCGICWNRIREVGGAR